MVPSSNVVRYWHRETSQHIRASLHGLRYAPGLVMMEFVSVFIPLWDVYSQKIRIYHQANLQIAQQARELEMRDVRKLSMYTMTALDTAILRNLDPLLRWAAEVDFTGENIIFLREVRNFKKKWIQRTKNGRTLTTAEMREQYEQAGMIYFTCINPETAQFPINIKSHILKDLSSVFRDLQFRPDGPRSVSRNMVTPWEDARPGSSAGSSHGTIFTVDMTAKRNTVDFLYPLPVTEVESKTHRTPGDENRMNGLEVPDSFSLEVFDDAFAEVRYLVFTNTWSR